MIINKKNYTAADLFVIKGYTKGDEFYKLDSALIRHYDLNGDGKVDLQDYGILKTKLGIK